MSTIDTPMPTPLLRGHPRFTALLGLGVVALVGLYATMPLWREGVLTLLSLCLLAGLFSLRSRDARLLVGLAVGLLGVAVLLLWRLEAPGFALAHDGLSALMVMAMVPVVGQAVSGFAHRRERLEAHRQALTQALADMSVAATCDPLTGLYNEVHMRECMAQEARRCQRAGTPLSLALFNLQGLRDLNTRLGYDQGDAALRQWAEGARTIFRQTDVVGRWSPELFIVLFADSTTEQAALGIERLREFGRAHAAQQPVLPFACGLVDWPADQPIDTAIERAQAALRGDGLKASSRSS